MTSLAFCGIVSSTMLTFSSLAIASCTRCTKVPLPSSCRYMAQAVKFRL